MYRLQSVCVCVSVRERDVVLKVDANKILICAPYALEIQKLFTRDEVTHRVVRERQWGWEYGGESQGLSGRNGEGGRDKCTNNTSPGNDSQGNTRLSF